MEAIFLLKNSFFENVDYADFAYSQLGIITGKTIDEFNIVRNNKISESAKRLAKHTKQTKKKLFNSYLKMHNPPLLLDIKEFQIHDTPYLKKAISENRNEGQS